MIEAYKKCLLCSLIEVGESPRAPKYTALVVLRFIKTGIAPYTEFAEAFGTRTLADLRASFEKHTATFERDKNLGLAKQCMQALIRRNIHRLTQTYLTLSLADIAQSAGLADAAEAERYIARMVAAGEISAAIDESKGMVQFMERAERFDSYGSVATMEQSIQSAVTLVHKLFEMNSQLATDTTYLSRMARERAPRWDGEEAMVTK